MLDAYWKERNKTKMHGVYFMTTMPLPGLCTYAYLVNRHFVPEILAGVYPCKGGVDWCFRRFFRENAGRVLSATHTHADPFAEATRAPVRAQFTSRQGLVEAPGMTVEHLCQRLTGGQGEDKTCANYISVQQTLRDGSDGLGKSITWGRGNWTPDESAGRT